MNSFDVFCNELLEEAKRFFEKSKIETDHAGILAYRHSSLLLAICALEAYINSVADELTIATDFPIHEKGLLLEREVRLVNGRFIITDALKISRLTDKIELLYSRYKMKELDNSESWWPLLKSGIKSRNALTHPKDNVEISEKELSNIIQSVIDCLSVLYKAIYKKSFPKSSLALMSKLTF